MGERKFLYSRIKLVDGYIKSEGMELNLHRRHGGTDGYIVLSLKEILKNMFEDEFIYVQGFDENLKEITFEIEIEAYVPEGEPKLSYNEIKAMIEEGEIKDDEKR